VYKEGQKVWSEIVSKLKLQVSTSIFKTWFSGSFVLDYKLEGEKGLLIVGVKNNFLKEQIESRYRETIAQILEDCGHKNIDTVFVVASKEVSTPPVGAPIFTGVVPEYFVKSIRSDSFNPNHTFGNFVVGFSNNLAYLAANRVAEDLGGAYNPFLVYGSVGVGKTHLLQAIGNQVLSRVVDAKVLYVTAEKFTNDYLESLSNKTQAAFRQKYRSPHLLLVDDIQFLAGKESTQDEFFHTFNEICLSGRQVVVASDRHPRELGRLKERLVSRFLGGMSADIGLPDVEMRTAIIIAKCAERGVKLAPELIAWVAQESTGGVRELEGTLISMLAYMKINAGKASVDDIKSAITSSRRPTQSAPTPGRVIDAVSRHFKVDTLTLRGSSRKASLVLARQVLMYLLRTELGLPLEQIGELVGGRDHSTVIHGIDKINSLISSSQSNKDEVLRVQTLIHR